MARESDTGGIYQCSVGITAGFGNVHEHLHGENHPRFRQPVHRAESAPVIRGNGSADYENPQAFLSSLTGYLEEMEHRGKLPRQDFECLAMTIFSATFGFTFLKASFGENLTKAERRDFCQKKCGNLCRRNTADKINILYLSGEKIQNRQAFQGPLTEQALPDGSAII